MLRDYPKMLILTKDVCLRTADLKKKKKTFSHQQCLVLFAMPFLKWRNKLYLSDNYTFIFGGTRWFLRSLPSHFMNQKHTEVDESTEYSALPETNHGSPWKSAAQATPCLQTSVS